MPYRDYMLHDAIALKMITAEEIAKLNSKG